MKMTYLLGVLSAAVSLLTVNSAYATDISSENFSIRWDVVDGGGGVSISRNYILQASAGQPSAIGGSTSGSYRIVAGYESIPDSDADKVRDTMDNCSLQSNQDQRDTDRDGFGNWCDPDFDNNMIVNASDLAYFKTNFFSADADADLNGDGIVNAADLAILKMIFFKPPGPSGLVP